MARRWFSSLRTRLSLLVIAAVLPCVALVVHDSIQAQRKAIADGEADALRLASVAASEHQQLLNQSRDLLFVLGQFSEQLFDPSSCQRRLAGLSTKFPALGTITVSDRNGKALCCGLPIPGGTTFSDRTWFIRAVKTREFVISEYLDRAHHAKSNGGRMGFQPPLRRKLPQNERYHPAPA